jgi:hypothetical protein
LRSFAHLRGCAPDDTASFGGWALVEAAGDGDAGLAKDVCDLSDAKAGGVIFERKVELGIVELEATEAVSVGKLAEGAELVVGERRLEFEFGFEERHKQIIPEIVYASECWPV